MNGLVVALIHKLQIMAIIASKHPSNYGYQYITLVGFSTSLSGSGAGSVRTFNWVVRPDTDFNEALCNDISMWSQDYCGATRGWTNNNLDFDSYRSPFGTASQTNSTICTDGGGSGATSTTYTLTNPSPGTFIRWQYRWNGSGGWNKLGFNESL